MRTNLRHVRFFSATVVATAVVLASCGGGSGPEAVAGTASGGPDLDDVDLSIDLDELDKAEEERLAAIDIDGGFQCPPIANQLVESLTDPQLVKVTGAEDGCRFHFTQFENGSLAVDVYEQANFIEQVQASADLLAASTGGREVAIPNALAAYVFDDGFLPENLPEPAEAGTLDAGRQVIGYFMGTRGVRLIAVFPDAVIGVHEGSDAASDETERVDLFVALAQNTTYALS